MDILLTICARGGSKGVPRKNIRDINGKPLIAHTIEHALEWGRAEDVVVSTDDDEIAEVAVEHGADVPFMRPDELARDETPTLPVLKHALKTMEERRGNKYDFLVDLDVTAPLRRIKDVDNSFRKLKNDPDAKKLYSVYEAEKNPYYSMVELDEKGYAHLSKPPEEEIFRRQDVPTVYALNSCIYVYRRDFVKTTESNHSDHNLIYVMPPERSVNIDRPLDLKMVRFLMEELKDQ